MAATRGASEKCKKLASNSNMWLVDWWWWNLHIIITRSGSQGQIQLFHGSFVELFQHLSRLWIVQSCIVRGVLDRHCASGGIDKHQRIAQSLFNGEQLSMNVFVAMIEIRISKPVLMTISVFHRQISNTSGGGTSLDVALFIAFFCLTV
jgi:hypothetical protein